jgi:sensor histidine kinase YesM
MFKKYFAFLFNLFFLCTFSQNIKIDSLKNEVKNLNSNKFETYNSLAWEFAKLFKKDSLFFYNNQSLKFVENEKQKGMFHVLNSKYYLMLQDFDKAIEETHVSIKLADKANDFITLSSAYNTLQNIENYKGNIENAYSYSKKNLEFALKSKNKSKILNSYVNLNAIALNLTKYNDAKNHYNQASKYFTNTNLQEQAVMKKNLGMALLKLQDNKRSIKYLVESEKTFLKLNITKPLSSIYSMLCENYTNLKIEKKALYYSKKCLETALNTVDSTNSYFAISKFNLSLKKLDRAKESILKSIELDYSMDNKLKLSEDYSILALINAEKGEINESDSLLLKSLANNEINFDTNAKSTLYRDLIINHFKKEKNTEYLNYFEKFISNLNTSLSQQKVKSLAELDKKYVAAEKESKIKTQQLQIQKEKNNKHIALGSFGLLLLLSGSGYFWFRNKQNRTNLVTQNTLLGLQQNLVAAELSNLNKQLDPHEIKNLLASISPEIQEKAPDSYKKMLKLFNLTKASLNSNSITDSIENQLQQIDDFLSLEKSMLSIPLDYSIENTFQNRQTQIPRLLLKNLVENALKHGIKQQETGGAIFVKVEEKDNFIYIVVDDNGKGRQHSISLDSGIGTTTYKKLFETLNPMNKEKATFEIIDKQQGTKVEVKIPTNYKYR